MRQPAPPPKTRLRYSGQLPKPLAGDVPYAKSRPELKGFTEAQIARAILDSDAWREVMKPKLDKLDKDRDREGKETFAYSSEELESVLVYGRVCGLTSSKATRDRLAGDRGLEARRLLGFDQPRAAVAKKRKRRGRVLTDGVPSEATLSRHRTRFTEHRRLEAWLELEQRFLDEHLETPELQAEARILNMDGSSILTHYTAPILDPKTKLAVNDDRITAPEAGYMPPSAGVNKSGHGWNLVSIVTQTGVPLCWRIDPLGASEKTVGDELIEEDLAKVIQKLDEKSGGDRQLRVLSADGGFTGPKIRGDCRELGILENIHTVSHGKHERSRKNAAKNDAERIPFDEPRYRNWYSNGHRELICRCGQGVTSKRIELDQRGAVRCRVEGRCPSCGSITITSGQWRKAQNPVRWVMTNPLNKGDRPDLLLGNPLTYNDGIAAEYGRGRWSHNEGFHGALVSRFHLLEGKRWLRRNNQVELETSMTFTIIHAIALEQRRRVNGTASATAPPLAA